jgi:hypothetical protein
VSETCEALLPLLAARALDKAALDPDEGGRIDRHLAECELCPDLLRDFEAAGGQLAGEPAAPPEVWPALEARLDAIDASEASAPRVLVVLSCTYCHDRLAREAAVFCAACLAPAHEDCWLEHGRCSAAGCGETRSVLPASLRRAPVPVAERAPAPPRRAPWLLLGVVFGAGAAALAGLTVVVAPTTVPSAPPTTARTTETVSPETVSPQAVAAAASGALQAPEKLIDPGRDGLTDLIQKRSALRTELSKQAEATIAALATAAFVIDHVGFVVETQPRLSGTVVDASPSLTLDATDPIRPGTTVRFGAGAYKLGPTYGSRAPLEDVAFVGLGPEKTHLTLALWKAKRVRIEGATIDCDDSDFLELREGGSVQVKNCVVQGYNSGAGGSSATFGVDTVLLVEDCLFEGRSGRDSRDAHGTAFDLRGEDLLYVRRTRFVDNQEILRASFPCAFDDCEARSSDRTWGVMDYGQGLQFSRRSASLFTGESNTSDSSMHFERATDDPAVVAYALGETKDLDATAKAVADGLELSRRLPYWIGLLLHEDAAIRTKARARLAELVSLPEGLAVYDAAATPFAREVAVARLLDWYDASRARLVWDLSGKGRYTLR